MDIGPNKTDKNTKKPIKIISSISFQIYSLMCKRGGIVHKILHTYHYKNYSPAGNNDRYYIKVPDRFFLFLCFLNKYFSITTMNFL